MAEMNNKRHLITYLLLFSGVAVATVAIVALLVNIFERKQEGKQRFYTVVPIGEYETNPEMWGHNFPDQYDGWKHTKDNLGRTEFGGSEPFSKIDEFPVIKTLYKGYPFSLDYNEERGHGWALTDVAETKRLGDAKPGTCMSCKSSDNVKLWHEIGAEAFYNTPMKDLLKTVQNPISCLNCHEPKNMELTMRNPAFLEAMKAQNIELSTADRQDKRSYACAQCHVEYYFETKKNPILHFPWKYGKRVEDIEKYYDEIGFYDWEHPDTKAKLIKVQHPDYEMWSTGIHSRSGVSCADCHMPFKRVGSQKISDHWVRSPLFNVAASCQTCHRWDEKELKARVSSIQQRTKKLLDESSTAIAEAIAEIKSAIDAGVPLNQLSQAQELHRKAQLRWDFVFSENSMGFHSPGESARWLAEAINYARQAQYIAYKAKKP